jgi:1,2-diacylglycerol 3-beta-galactosyltransferase
MPDWMSASDLIITKAGPGTIMESLACGLPILLSGFLPGQEEGNVTFVEESGVGELVEEPQEIVSKLKKWLAPKDTTLAQRRARAHQLARPRAALEIAAALDQVVQVERQSA